MGKFAELLGQATVVFLAELDGHRTDLLMMDEDDVFSEVSGLIGVASDEVLDERRDDYIMTLLLCCLDNPNLFTKEPESVSCVTENGSPGQQTAAHWVYHNLYDALRAALEQEYDQWSDREQRQASKQVGEG